MTVMHNSPREEQTAKKLLLWVFALIALILVTTMVTAARRVARVPFSKADWDRGAHNFTADNPRMRMRDDLVSRLQGTTLTRQEVEAMLGKPEPIFGIKMPKGGPIVSSSAPGEMAYVLGIEPGKLTAGRSMDVLILQWSKPLSRKGAIVVPPPIYAYVSTQDYPTGATIVPWPPTSARTPAVPPGMGGRP